MSRKKGQTSAFQRASAILKRQQQKLTFREIARDCKISKSTAHRIWKCREKLMQNKGGKTADKNTRRGRKPKIAERDLRVLQRTLIRMRKRNVNVKVMEVVRESGISMNKLGYKFLQARKKGLLTEKDRNLRLRHAREMKRILARHPNFYEGHVSFYLDGVSFVHKYNPYKQATTTKSRVWRRKGEGLQITAKGSKDMPGGRRIHMMVGIAHRKGVILKETYEKMNATYFSDFIRNKFNISFAKSGVKDTNERIFVMDNDPSQIKQV